jgi:ATP-dependent helicase HrpA
VRAEVAKQLSSQSGVDERKGITAWDFGDLPHEVSTERNGVVVRGYPALLDDDDSVSIRVFTNEALQSRVMRTGVRRLLLLTVPVSKRAIEQHLTNSSRLAIAGAGVMPLEHFEVECLQVAADRVIDEHGGTPWTEAGFTALAEAAREHLAGIAADALRAAAAACEAAQSVRLRLDRLQTSSVEASATDARRHLERLVRSGFIVSAGLHHIGDIARYVHGIDQRLAKVPEAPAKDLAKLRDVLALEQRYGALLARTRREDVTPEMVDLGWQLEECRVATFAQSLGVKGGASVAKAAKALQRLGA